MTKAYLFETFKALNSAEAKVEFLRSIAKLNLPYEINFENLIIAWESQVEVEPSAE
jgi:hypothetical protein